MFRIFYEGNKEATAGLQNPAPRFGNGKEQQVPESLVRVPARC
jgi:hypothetical protein